MKSLKARNQTLAPPFPELRYLSLAYNKVTLGFSTSLPRSTDGRVGCELLWPESQSSHSVEFSRIQAQEFSGWGFSGLGKQKASRQRQESIDSVTDTDLPLTMCQALCWALGIQLREEIQPLPLRSLSPTGKTEHEQIITV